MRTDIRDAIEASDVAEAVGAIEEQPDEAWKVHLSLFPVVQRVMNPPFINPHLPKMYRICREFIPRIEREDIPALVRLEVEEYARRPKLEKIAKGEIRTERVTFEEIESALALGDRLEAAGAITAFHAQSGCPELVRRMLLLGSGYLDKSLGHSISCTAFILLEVMERADQDPWPAFAMLADYFQKGRFHSTPALHPEPVPEDEMKHHILRAASGRGIINLHHTITLYAIERVRSFFSPEDYHHLIRSWIAFMGNKEAEPITVDGRGQAIGDYAMFYSNFSDLNVRPTLASLMAMHGSEEGRSRIGRYLIKAVCDQYQGNYNPHYLTGLGSALWVLDSFPDRDQIVGNALYQYLDYYFADLRS